MANSFKSKYDAPTIEYLLDKINNGVFGTVFAERAEFPATGEEEILYVATDEKKIYIWIDDDYEPITGGGSAEPTYDCGSVASKLTLDQFLWTRDSGATFIYTDGGYDLADDSSSNLFFTALKTAIPQNQKTKLLNFSYKDTANSTAISPEEAYFEHGAKFSIWFRNNGGTAIKIDSCQASLTAGYTKYFLSEEGKAK